METKRQLKYGKLLLKELSSIFQTDAKHLFGNAFITITHVEVSPDLSVAKVYLSFLMTENKQQTLQSIVDKSKNIRQILGEKIRFQVRIVPNLVFFLDDSADYASKMDKIIGDLHIPKNN
jgi:ribosome-binding factor A